MLNRTDPAALSRRERQATTACTREEQRAPASDSRQHSKLSTLNYELSNFEAWSRKSEARSLKPGARSLKSPQDRVSRCQAHPGIAPIVGSRTETTVLAAGTTTPQTPGRSEIVKHRCARGFVDIVTRCSGEP